MDPNEKGKGCPEDAEKQAELDSLCAFLYENGECQYSLAELEDRINEDDGKPAYSRKHLKKQTTCNIWRQFNHNRLTCGKWGGEFQRHCTEDPT